MNPTTQIAIRAARKAGSLVMRYFQRADTLRIQRKSEHELVSTVDQQAEQAIIQVIHDAYPHHAILAEESGVQGQADYEWIIDPLDGTHNYLHGLPNFAVSIALRHRGLIQTGVIYEPVRNDLYVAHRGGGALLNDRRLRIRQQMVAGNVLVSSSIGACDADQQAVYFSLQRALIETGVGLRQSGSSALDLAYVAAGYLDGTWQQAIQPWDIAAGMLLVREAGGIVTSLQGGDDPLASGNLLAGHRKIHASMLKHVTQRD
ncbi:MAG: inositol monophosphatase family protein [Pseudomonadota bacterium]